MQAAKGILTAILIAALICAEAERIDLRPVAEEKQICAVPSGGVGRIIPQPAETAVCAVRDIGCAVNDPCTPCWDGWDGHTSPEWEIDLFVRLVQHESRGCSPLAWRYVADTVLNRLSDGRWGGTIYAVMSATEPDGSAAFTAWKYVYGPQVELYSEIREAVMQSFSEGPELTAKYLYFSTDLPDWAVDAICVDGIWFYGSIWDEGGAT